MYDRFFGFKERPFRLVPDPAYLFLGRTHREAMAHLIYAVEAGDGFVEITGEVGTGKTTLCRAFLENLDEATSSAYIFNPPSDPVDLLQAINKDLGVDSASTDPQELIHLLNLHLMEQKARDRNVVLVIDEAQNLNLHVLEQIRLLSNLETTRNKLIQIILVGQPELRRMLDSQELRQLRQRITLSCRIEPLDLPETEAYVRHRIAVASGNGSVLFSGSAIRRIFRFSGGIPRLINMACDRSLLTAYTWEAKAVDGKITKSALNELQKKGGPLRAEKKGRSLFTIGTAALLIALVSSILYWYFRQPDVFMRTATQQALSGPVRMKVPVPVAEPAPPPSTSLPAKEAALSDLSAGVVSKSIPLEMEKSADPFRSYDGRPLSRSEAFEIVCRRWKIVPGQYEENPLEDEASFYRKAAEAAGLKLYEVSADLSLLRRLNLPAILSCRQKEVEGYLAWIGVKDGSLLLGKPGSDAPFAVSPQEVAAIWTGRAYVPWKDFFLMKGEIPGEAAGESVLTLKLLLRDIGFRKIDISPSYDAAARNAVMAVQAKHGLPVDGVVGSMTKIALYQEKPSLGIPSLTEKEGS